MFHIVVVCYLLIQTSNPENSFQIDHFVFYVKKN